MIKLVLETRGSVIEGGDDEVPLETENLPVTGIMSEFCVHGTSVFKYCLYLFFLMKVNIIRCLHIVLNARPNLNMGNT